MYFYAKIYFNGEEHLKGSSKKMEDGLCNLYNYLYGAYVEVANLLLEKWNAEYTGPWDEDGKVIQSEYIEFLREKSKPIFDMLFRKLDELGRGCRSVVKDFTLDEEGVFSMQLSEEFGNVFMAFRLIGVHEP